MVLTVTNLVGFGGGSQAEGNDEFTQLLIHFDGADASTTFTDVSQNAFTVTTVGDGQVDTAQFMFGDGSLLCLGTSDGASVPDDVLLRPGTGDFTIDMWLRFNSVSAVDKVIYDKGANAAGSFFLFFYSVSLRVAFWTGATPLLQDSSAVSTGVWYHFAVVRSGSTIKMFRDGIEVDSASNSTNFNRTEDVLIGTRGGLEFNGWIDELRYSSIARWTTDFTPPTAPYG